MLLALVTTAALAVLVRPPSQDKQACDASFQALAPRELHAMTMLFHEPLLDRTGTLQYMPESWLFRPIGGPVSAQTRAGHP